MLVAVERCMLARPLSLSVLLDEDLRSLKCKVGHLSKHLKLAGNEAMTCHHPALLRMQVFPGLAIVFALLCS